MRFFVDNNLSPQLASDRPCPLRLAAPASAGTMFKPDNFICSPHGTCQSVANGSGAHILRADVR